MSGPINIPAWLEASLADPHLNIALSTLRNREFIRDCARNYPRYRLSITSPTRILASHVQYYSVEVGCDPTNQKFNRYQDVQPYDRTRVTVEGGSGGESDTNVTGDYFSASWVRELFGGKWWIATQAPPPNSIHTFLTILLRPSFHPPTPLCPGIPSLSTSRSRIRTIVQLTRFVENGRQKADTYIPGTVGQSWVVPSMPWSKSPLLKVTLLASQKIEAARCIQSTVSILPVPAEGVHRWPVVFRHMLYYDWPDHGVPEDQERFLNFVRLVDRTNKDISLPASQPPHVEPDVDPDPPIMVHCSAGIGRTGTFVALSSLLRAHGCLSQSPSVPSIQVTAVAGLPPSPLGSLPESVEGDLVVQEVDSLREQRPRMVERDEQVKFVYRVLEAALTG